MRWCLGDDDESRAGEVVRLTAGGTVLGILPGASYEEGEIELRPGSLLALFSDGLIEARREGSDEMFGFERLEQSLARHAGRGVEGVRDGVLGDVAHFTGDAPREDDQTILVLRLP
jgi:sigma-B regulation protein RsbU (phosphoserine phosphatase)